MNLEEAIAREEALAYSFGERWKRLGEKIEDLPILEEEHRQMAEWLKELKAYRKIRRILSQNRVATEIGRDRHGRDRYGEVVMWDDIKRAFGEVDANDT